MGPSSGDHQRRHVRGGEEGGLRGSGQRLLLGRHRQLVCVVGPPGVERQLRVTVMQYAHQNRSVARRIVVTPIRRGFRRVQAMGVLHSACGLSGLRAARHAGAAEVGGERVEEGVVLSLVRALEGLCVVLVRGERGDGGRRECGGNGVDGSRIGNPIVVEREAARGGALQLDEPAGNCVRSVESELVLRVMGFGEPHFTVRADADDVVALASDQRIRQVDDIQGDVAVSPLLIQRIPVHEESAPHDDQVARSPHALSLLLCRSLLEANS